MKLMWWSRINVGVAVIDMYAQGFANVLTESVAALR